MVNLAWLISKIRSHTLTLITDTQEILLASETYIPLVALWVGWHREEALPGCDCSGRFHQGLSASCSAACPPTRRGGCSATGGYTSACPAAVGDLVAGATEISASEGEAGGVGGARWERGYFVGVGSLSVKTLITFPRRSRTGGRNPLRDTTIIPSMCLAIFPVSVQMCSRTAWFVLASSTPELQLT